MSTSCVLRCSPEDGQCHCLPNMMGRRCSDPAPGYFLPQLDYFLYEAELAAPLHGRRSPSPPSTPPTTYFSSSSSLVCVMSKCDDQISDSITCVHTNSINVYSNSIFIYFMCSVCVYFQMNPAVLPECEQYFKEQGYDFKFTNGRVVLIRRTRRTRRLARRRRRQGQVGHLCHFLLHFCFDQWGGPSLTSQPIRSSSSDLSMTDVFFCPAAGQHPSLPGSSLADHSPSENNRSANHLDRHGIGQSAGGGRA